jgi:hypothetical protein
VIPAKEELSFDYAYQTVLLVKEVGGVEIRKSVFV